MVAYNSGHWSSRTAHRKFYLVCNDYCTPNPPPQPPPRIFPFPDLFLRIMDSTSYNRLRLFRFTYKTKETRKQRFRLSSWFSSLRCLGREWTTCFMYADPPLDLCINVSWFVRLLIWRTANCLFPTLRHFSSSVYYFLYKECFVLSYSIVIITTLFYKWFNFRNVLINFH